MKYAMMILCFMAMISQGVAQTGKPVWTRGGHTSAVQNLYFDNEGILLSSSGKNAKTSNSSSNDGIVRAWNVNSLDNTELYYGIRPYTKMHITGMDLYIVDIEMSAVNDSYVAALYGISGYYSSGPQVSNYGGQKIVFYERSSGKAIDTIDIYSYNSRILGMTIHPKSSIAAIDTSIYNFETRKKVATIKEKNIVLNKFSPDGEILAAVTSNNGISLWNSQTGEFLKRLSFTISASVIEFSKDRKTLATGDSLGNISIWDVQSGILQTGFKNGSGIVNGLCFQNNYILAGSNDSTVKKWNLNSGILEDTLRFPYKVTSIALHPDDTKIAVGLDDGTIILTSFPVGEFTVLTKFKGLVSSLLITEDNQTITTLKRDYSPSAHSIQIRSIETGEISDSIVFKGNNSVVVAPNNKIVAIRTDSVTKFVQLADTNNQNILLSRFTNSPAYTQFAFSPDSRTLVSADQDTLINIWNISTGLLKAQLRRSNKGADYIGSFSPDGSLFLTADNVNYQERASAIWNTSDYSRRLKIPTFGLNGKISSNNSRAVFKNKNSVIIWDVQKNELLDSITLDATIEVADYNFSPNSQYLIIAQKNLYVWDIAARKVSAILDEPQAEEQYRYLAFSPNGRYLVTAGSILRLWDLNGITSIENETPVLKTTELLKVFPNPSNGILTLQLDSFKNIPDGEIRIYNSLGMLLKTVPAEFLKEMKIDCSELSGGVYFVELSSEKGVIARTSFIIAQ